MNVVFDIEGNALENPTKIWVIVCKDIDTGKYHIFRNVLDDPTEKERFISFAAGVHRWIGHHCLGYDVPVLKSLLEVRGSGRDVRKVFNEIAFPSVVDTFIISKMVDYSRKGGHSIEQYGDEFEFPKGIPIGGELLPAAKLTQAFFNQYSKDLEDYCIRDVDICHRVYNKYIKFLSNSRFEQAIKSKHAFQLVINRIHSNGFAFNVPQARKYLNQVTSELGVIDKEILDAFPPRTVVIREFTPKATKYGTTSRTSVPRSLHDRIHTFEIGKTYQHTREEPFNPASHKQLIQVLNEAGWKPEEKTKAHVDAEREGIRLKRSKSKESGFDLRLRTWDNNIMGLRKSGWKINENNLATLPPDAPAPAKLLAQRILLEARRRTLTEWLSLVKADGRIHAEFQSPGTWTHRVATRKPNVQNIPNEYDTLGRKKLLGKEMRSLWCAPRNRLLVGVDAEGMQLRIFAHYINDPEFTRALVEGKKDDKTDPHSLNQRILGSVCKSRAAAKRFIFAFLLGAGIDKLAEILACSRAEGQAALDNLLERYKGLAVLKETIIPADARRGYFFGLAGAPIRIPGETESSRKHLAMSGYLQEGEATCMELAALKWADRLDDYNALLVNYVHDEWQTEVPNNLDIALKVAKMQADSLREVGEELGLNCPLAGSYWNDDAKDYTIGANWAITH